MSGVGTVMSSGRRVMDKPYNLDPIGNAILNFCSSSALGRRLILLPKRSVLVSILKTEYR
jgi:hypothetical protein